jgi:hypothetical protein
MTARELLKTPATKAREAQKQSSGNPVFSEAAASTSGAGFARLQSNRNSSITI